MTSLALKRRVLELIDQSKSDNIALMQKLVQIPSLSGDEAQIGEFLFKEMTRFSITQAGPKIVSGPMATGASS